MSTICIYLEVCGGGSKDGRNASAGIDTVFLVDINFYVSVWCQSYQGEDIPIIDVQDLNHGHTILLYIYRRPLAGAEGGRYGRDMLHTLYDAHHISFSN